MRARTLLAAAVVVGASCNYRDALDRYCQSSAGRPCQADSDCCPGVRCTAGTCTPADAGTGGGSGGGAGGIGGGSAGGGGASEGASIAVTVSGRGFVKMSGGGLCDVGPCVEPLAGATLEAFPAMDGGFGFAGWNGGGCTGQQFTCAPIDGGSITAAFTPLNVIFLTDLDYPSTTYLDLAAADTACANEGATGATASTLPANARYVAWLSGTGADGGVVSALTRLRLARDGGEPRGWMRPDHAPFADSINALTILPRTVYYSPEITGLLADDIKGVATATDERGLPMGLRCDAGTIRTGASMAGYVNWTSQQDSPCNSFRLYCLQVDHSSALRIYPATGRRAFLSETLGTGATTVAGWDTICANEALAAGYADAGSFRAFVATASQSAAAHLDAGPGPAWVRPDGLAVVPAGSDLATLPRLSATLGLTPKLDFVNLDVWTGAVAPGAPADGGSCRDWTSTADAGNYGGAFYANEDWFSVNSAVTSCSRSLPVYCFQR